MESTDLSRWRGEWTDDPGVGVRRVQSWTHGPVVTERSRAGALCATDPQWPRVFRSTAGILGTRHARVLPKSGLAPAYFRGSEPSSLPRYAM